VTAPDDEAGDLGVVFFHNEGFSTACGHGTIALVTWALRSGRLPMIAPVTRLSIDVPSGRLAVEADIEAGDVAEVRFTNVPSMATALGLVVEAAGANLTIDVSYGGAFYASVEAASVGLSVSAGDLPRCIELARRIRTAMAGHPATRHPQDDRLSGLYGVIFFEPIAPGHQRNVTVFADGEVDRSPCGSGTSARLAVLHARGELGVGDTLLHDGIAGGRFVARITSTTDIGGSTTVTTQVGGRAYKSGEARFELDPRDPIGLGFLLR
jgi:proline racemase/trans-L-3-hydroxyproline dehydratase